MKLLEGCLTRRKIRNFEMLTCRKRESLYLQQMGSLECQDTIIGCVCVTTCVCNRQFGVSGHNDRSRLHHYQTSGNVSDLSCYASPPPPPASHPHPHFPPPPPTPITTQQHDRYISVTHLWNRFQPATVTAGTITLLKRICSNVCVSKAYAEDALLFVCDGGSHP